MNNIKIGLFQYAPAWEDADETIKKIDKLIIETKNLNNTSLLIFPEMSLTGFTMNSRPLAEDRSGVSFNYFSQLSKKLKKHIFAGVIEKDGKEIYNSLIHFDDKGIIKKVYRKIHPFNLSNESKYYSAGSKPVTTQIGEITFGLSICYDLRFPELYRTYGKARIDILVNIANWPASRITHWHTLLRARAIENQSYMLGITRVGKDPYVTYPGGSSAINPMGEILKESSEEGVLIIEVEKNVVSKVREKMPFLTDIKLI